MEVEQEERTEHTFREGRPIRFSLDYKFALVQLVLRLQIECIRLLQSKRNSERSRFLFVRPLSSPYPKRFFPLYGPPPSMPSVRDVAPEAFISAYSSRSSCPSSRLTSPNSQLTLPLTRRPQEVRYAVLSLDTQHPGRSGGEGETPSMASRSDSLWWRLTRRTPQRRSGVVK